MGSFSGQEGKRGCIAILFTRPGEAYERKSIYFPLDVNIIAMRPARGLWLKNAGKST
jgi:hypothetical protein